VIREGATCCNPPFTSFEALKKERKVSLKKICRLLSRKCPESFPPATEEHAFNASLRAPNATSQSLKLNLALRRKNYKTLRLSNVSESICLNYPQLVRNCSRRAVGTKSKRVVPKCNSKKRLCRSSVMIPSERRGWRTFFSQRG